MVELRPKAASSQYSAFSENQEHFTAKDAKDAKEEEALQRVNPDRKGLEGDGNSCQCLEGIGTSDRGLKMKPERRLMKGAHSRGRLCHTSIAETYAVLGSPGMRWDTQGGVPKIADIADIARHRRDRKGKTLLQFDTDDTDQESGDRGTS